MLVLWIRPGGCARPGLREASGGWRRTSLAVSVDSAPAHDGKRGRSRDARQYPHGPPDQAFRAERRPDTRATGERCDGRSYFNLHTSRARLPKIPHEQPFFGAPIPAREFRAAACVLAGCETLRYLPKRPALRPPLHTKGPPNSAGLPPLETREALLPTHAARPAEFHGWRAPRMVKCRGLRV